MLGGVSRSNFIQPDLRVGGETPHWGIPLSAHFYMKTIFFKHGQEIIHEGMSSDCAYIIESGRVEVSKTDTNGKRKVIGTLKENDIFGEMGLIDGLPRSCTVVALEDTSITVLSQEAFNSLADHKPQALMPVLRVLATPSALDTETCGRPPGEKPGAQRSLNSGSP